MDEALALANQRIDDMSFKDLTPKPEETVNTPARGNESKPAGKDIPAKSKTS